MIQGDFFLYSEPDGPFFGFRSGPDTPEAFQKDLAQLDHLARYFGQVSN